MTTKLYDQDAYMQSFVAHVEEVRSLEQGKLSVLLNQTAFFPNEGGQSCDKGTLNGYAVLSVDVDKTHHIWHTVNAPAETFVVGGSVQGNIDWVHRFSNMQMHSAEHLFSGLVHRHFGYENSGFHLSDTTATMDFSGPLTEDDVRRLEQEVNDVIFQNLPSFQLFPNENERQTLHYRSKKAIDGTLRLVGFEGIDLCACCAPHVKSTMEIGVFVVTNAQSYKGGVRLNYLAGQRATAHLLHSAHTLQSVCQSFSATPSTLNGFLQKLKQDNQTLQTQLNATQAEQLYTKLVSATETLHFIQAMDVDMARKTLVQVSESSGKNLFLFIKNQSGEGYRFIFSGSQGDGVKAIFERLKLSLSLKGGGQHTLVQGSTLVTKEEIERAFLELK